MSAMHARYSVVCISNTPTQLPFIAQDKTKGRSFPSLDCPSIEFRTFLLKAMLGATFFNAKCYKLCQTSHWFMSKLDFFGSDLLLINYP